MKMNKNRNAQNAQSAISATPCWCCCSWPFPHDWQHASTYQNKVLATVGIKHHPAVSLNVATGYLGQLPLGHAGFMAVGAYTAPSSLVVSSARWHCSPSALHWAL